MILYIEFWESQTATITAVHSGLQGKTANQRSLIGCYFVTQGVNTDWLSSRGCHGNM